MATPDDLGGSRGAIAWTRRGWLRSAVIGGSLVGLGAVMARVRLGGYEIPEATRVRLASFEPWHYVVMQSLARRVVAADPTLAADPAQPVRVPTPDELGVAEFVDRYLAAMRSDLRRDFLRMIGLVEHVAPFWVGHETRFTELSASTQDEVLEALEASSIDQLRAGFQGIKSLIMMGYYRDARTFSLIGYGGPFVPPRAERGL